MGRYLNENKEEEHFSEEKELTLTFFLNKQERATRKIGLYSNCHNSTGVNCTSNANVVTATDIVSICTNRGRLKCSK